MRDVFARESLLAEFVCSLQYEPLKTRCASKSASFELISECLGMENKFNFGITARFQHSKVLLLPQVITADT